MSTRNQLSISHKVIGIMLVLISICYSEHRIFVMTVDGIGDFNIIRKNNIIETGYVNLDDILYTYEATNLEKVYRGPHPLGRRLYTISFPEQKPLERIMNELSGTGIFIYFEPIYPLPLAQTEPNDSLWYGELGLQQIEAEYAWDISTGSDQIIISINDTGIDYAHPDLGPNMWQNLGEDDDGDGKVLQWNASSQEWEFDPGDINSVDDDNNGYVDDFVGWDFWNNDNDPIHPHNNSCHGTQVAGTAAETLAG
ncbi:MAG: S8 family serine peptidase [Candidatus Neomarinimicrobiota bacterium]